MLIKTLVENTSIHDSVQPAHGLSFYIETNGHKILFDLGPDDFFEKNAEHLGVDISSVDIVVISHGHADHGGGLKRFFELNESAMVYVQKQAFEKHFSRRSAAEIKFIGLDKALSENKRIVFVEQQASIGDSLKIFADVSDAQGLPTDNKSLFMEGVQGLEPDDFIHEQNLVICENDRKVLFLGCAHKGILNILARFYELYGRYPDDVLGGFHLYSQSRHTGEPPEKIRQLSELLKKMNSHFYTCHCTGTEPYQLMKTYMSGQINYLAAGSRLML